MSPEATFGYVIGGFALVGILHSTLHQVRNYLPSHQLKKLHVLLEETNHVYEKGIAEDLLPPALAHRAHVKLRMYVLTGVGLEITQYTYFS